MEPSSYDRGGLDENPFFGDAGGTADMGNSDDWRLTGCFLKVMVGGGELNGFFVGREFHVGRVDTGAAGSAIRFCVEWGNSEVWQGDPFSAADHQPWHAWSAPRQAERRGELSRGGFDRFCYGFENRFHRLRSEAAIARACSPPPPNMRTSS